MTRPGDRLRAVASHLFDEDTMEHLIDPILADLRRPLAGRVYICDRCAAHMIDAVRHARDIKRVDHARGRVQQICRGSRWLNSGWTRERVHGQASERRAGS